MVRSPAEVLKELREQSGYTSEQLSARVGWVASRWGNLEKGNQEFKEAYLKDLLRGDILRATDPEYREIKVWLSQNQPATPSGEPVAPPPSRPSPGRPQGTVIMAIVAVIAVLVFVVVVGPKLWKKPAGVVKGFPTQAPLPTYTPYPTYTQEAGVQPVTGPVTPTPYPTYTAYPTYTPPLIPTEPLTPEPVMELPFVDNFDNGASEEWETIRGSWRMMNGTYKPDWMQSEWAVILVGDENWTDYVVEAVCPPHHNTPSSFIGIIVREYKGKHIRIESSRETTTAYLVDAGGGHEIASADGSLTEHKEFGTGKVVVKGSIFEVYRNGQLIMTFEDKTCRQGRVGLAARRISASEPGFASFVVNPLD